MLASLAVIGKLHPRLLPHATLGVMLLVLAACAQPRVQEPAGSTQTPELNDTSAIMADGYRLPLSTWQPRKEPVALLLALHGFNDYRNAFRDPAAYFSRHGIITVAYDQRGFGDTEQRGIWPGEQTLVRDARDIARLLCMEYPGLPLFLLGESMGGAVLIEAMNGAYPECVAGTILVAPAVWGWQTMPWWQAMALRLATALMPSTKLTGEGLDIRPSDNIEMLRALGMDPLVIKETRVDALYGVTNLMTAAFDHSAELGGAVLLLYGAHDEIIPPAAVCRLAMPGLGDNPAVWQLALYPDGYHMLLRDLQAEVVLRDVVSWIADRQSLLPSGYGGNNGAAGLERLCAAL